MYHQEGGMIKKRAGKIISSVAKKKEKKKKAGSFSAVLRKAALKKKSPGKGKVKAASGTGLVKKTDKDKTEKKKTAGRKTAAAKKKRVLKKAVRKTSGPSSRETLKKTGAVRETKRPVKSVKTGLTAVEYEEEKEKGKKKTTQKAAIKTLREKAAEKPDRSVTPESPVRPRKRGVETRAITKEPWKIQEPEIIKAMETAAEAPPVEKLEAFPGKPAPAEELPSEYGENEVTLMPVNPCRLFAFWEIRKETLNIFRGALNLRVYDVTGIDLDATDAHSCRDAAVLERIGKTYIDVSPSREYVADIGILYDGIFIGIARSPRVSSPVAYVPGEEKFLPELLDVPRAGYNI